MGIQVGMTAVTGMVGHELLKALLNDNRVDKVISFGRRKVDMVHPELEQIIIEDMLDWKPARKALTGLNAFFWNIGVSSTRHERSYYLTIMQGYPISCAQNLRAVSPDCVFHFTSGGGTNREGRIQWQKDLAKTEDELMNLGFPRVICYRPGMIWSPPNRPARYWFEYPMLPIKWFGYGLKGFSITCEDFVKCTLKAQFSNAQGIKENREMRDIASN